MLTLVLLASASGCDSEDVSGVTWEQAVGANSKPLRGVWGSCPSDVFAVGMDGRILHFDGSSYSTMESGTWRYLMDIWGSSSSDVFAVGDGGTILHYDGNKWSSQNSETTDSLHGIWGNSSSDIFAVGDGGTIIHYDGTKWSSQNYGTDYRLNDIWGSSGSNVFVVGDGGTILHYDGSKWSSHNSDTYNRLNSIWGSSGSDVFTVGNKMRDLASRIQKRCNCFFLVIDMTVFRAVDKYITEDTAIKNYGPQVRIKTLFVFAGLDDVRRTADHLLPGKTGNTFKSGIDVFNYSSTICN